MSSKRVPTGASKITSDEPENIGTEVPTYVSSIASGFVLGTIICVVTLLILFALNLIGYGGLLFIVDAVYIVETIVFWISSSFVIWFGPSPSYAWFRSKISLTRSPIKPIPTDIAMRLGLKRFIMGIVSLAFSNIIFIL